MSRNASGNFSDRNGKFDDGGCIGCPGLTDGKSAGAELVGGDDCPAGNAFSGKACSGNDSAIIKIPLSVCVVLFRPRGGCDYFFSFSEDTGDRGEAEILYSSYFFNT